MANSKTGDGTYVDGAPLTAGTVNKNQTSTVTIDNGAYTFTQIRSGVPEAGNSPANGVITITGDTTSVTVQDPASYSYGEISVGVDYGGGSSGVLRIEDGAYVRSVNNAGAYYYTVYGGYKNLSVGIGSGSDGTVVVTGSNTGGPSTLFLEGGAAGIDAGRAGGVATISVNDSGYLRTLFAEIGGQNGVGTLNVDGSGSTALFTSEYSTFFGYDQSAYQGGLLRIGVDGGTGYFNVTGGGALEVSNDGASVTEAPTLIMAEGANAYASGVVTGLNSSLDFIQNGAADEGIAGYGGTGLVVGRGGEAHLTVDLNASVQITGDQAALEVGRGLYDTNTNTPLAAAPRSTLNITNGASVNVDSKGYAGAQVAVGTLRNSFGQITVDGANSRLVVQSTTDVADDDVTGRIVVGALGNGVLNVTNGGEVEARELSVGAQGAKVKGDNTTDYFGSDYNLAYTNGGIGYALISGGSTVTVTATAGTPDRGVNVGIASKAIGDVTVTGAGSTLTSQGGDGNLTLGEGGDGDLNVLSGGRVNATSISVAEYSGGKGVLTVSGAGSELVVSSVYGSYNYYGTQLGGVVRVGGYDADGKFYADNGASVTIDNYGAGTYGARLLFGAFYDNQTGGGSAYGRIAGSGTNVSLIQSGEVKIAEAGPGGNGASLLVGQLDEGELIVTDGATVDVLGDSARMVVGVGGDYFESVFPQATTGSYVTISGGAAITVDSEGYGFTPNPVNDYSNGAYVTVGQGIGSVGELSVDGAGSLLSVTSSSNIAGDYQTGEIVVGSLGQGALSVTNGGAVEARGMTVGDLGFSSYYNVYSGYNANATGGGDGVVDILSGSTVTLTALDGAPYRGLNIARSSGSTGVVTVGADAVLTSQGGAGRIRVGQYGDATLNIDNYGTVNGFFVDAGRGKLGTGVINVTGADAALNVNDNYGDFSADPNFAGEAGFLRLGRDNLSDGRMYVTGGAQVNVSNAAGSKYDNPTVQLGRNNGSFGLLRVDGSGTPGGGSGPVASAVNITQTGPVGDYVAAGGIGPYGPRLIVGSGGRGRAEVINGAEINIVGADAGLFVGAGRDGNNTTDTSVLNILTGSVVTVDSQGYGGKQVFDKGGQNETYAYLGAEVHIGNAVGITAEVLVDGAGSLLQVISSDQTAGDSRNGEIKVGDNGGTGTLTVSNGGAVEARELQVANNAGSDGTVNIQSGGSVTITGNAASPYQGVSIGDASAAGRIYVDGAGSVLTSTGAQTPGARAEGAGILRVGRAGDGTLEATNGGEVNAFFVEVGRAYGATGNLNILSGSTVNISNEFGTFAPYGPTGGLLRIGREDGSFGRTFINGGGTLNVTNIANETDPLVQGDRPSIKIGDDIGSVGRLDIYSDGGAGTLNLVNYGDSNDGYEPGEYHGPRLILGENGGQGLMSIRGGVANIIGEDASVVVGYGPDTDNPGASDESRLLIFQGGVMNVDSRDQEVGANYQEAAKVVVGYQSSGHGKITVTGAGSQLNIFSDNYDDVGTNGSVEFPNTALGATLAVGLEGEGRLYVEAGGVVNVDGADDAVPSLLIGYGDATYTPNAYGYVSVDGVGSKISVNSVYGGARPPEAYFGASTGLIRVGSHKNSDGVLVIQNGGVVESTGFNSTAQIATDVGSTGRIRVTGAGSELDIGGDLRVGSPIDLATGYGTIFGGGVGELEIHSGGTVFANNTIVGDTSSIEFDNGVLTGGSVLVGGVFEVGASVVSTATINADFTLLSSAATTFELTDNLPNTGDFLEIDGDGVIDTTGFTIDIGAGFADAQIGDVVPFLVATGTLAVSDFNGFAFTGTSAPVGTAFQVVQSTEPARTGPGTEEQLAVLVREVFQNDITIQNGPVQPEGDPGDGAVFASFDLTRTGDLSETITVDFAVSAYGANPISVDDLAAGAFPTGQATFAAGSATATIDVQIALDDLIEPDETFKVTISNPQTALLDGAQIVVADSIGTIQNDDNAPVAVDDPNVGAFQTPEGQDFLISHASLLANDTDADSDPLFITRFDGVSAQGVSITAFDANNILFSATGLFDNLAPGDSLFDSFTYTVSDGEDGTDDAVVNIEITGVNDDPIAIDDDFFTDEATAFTGDLFADNGGGVDFDLDDGDTFTVSLLNGTGFISGSETILPSGALLTLNSDGTFDYDPNGAFDALFGFQSDFDSFTYTIQDSFGGVSAAATVDIQIDALDLPPTAVDDNFTTDEDTPFEVDVLNGDGADIDPEGQPLTITQINGAAVSPGSTVVDPSGALLTLTATGTIIYDPNGAFDFLASGDNDADSFTYTVTDAGLNTDTATVSATITGINDAPVVNDDQLTVLEDVVLTGNLFADNGLGIDFDPEGDAFSITQFLGGAAAPGATVVLASGAALTVQANGDFVYDQNGVFDALEDGESDLESFTYTVTDANNDSRVGTAEITIQGDTDTIFGDGAGNLILGTALEDNIDGLGGDDFISGLDGDDTLIGGSGNDVIRGGGGDDTLDGGADNDKLFGEGGNDDLRGGGGDDRLLGRRDSDVLTGDAGSDTLAGGGASDDLFGGIGDDLLKGGVGGDLMDGEDGADKLRGGGGDDSMRGGAGIDTLSGSRGADTLDGGLGADRIKGGAGNDLLTGGGDGDTFVFAQGDGDDQVFDFEDGLDKIKIGAGADSFADVTITDLGADVEVAFADVTILLRDTDETDITDADFLF